MAAQADHVYPQSVEEIANVIGIEKALLLCRSLTFSGSRPWRVVVYVPKRMPADHRLVEILGCEDAMALSCYFGGEVLQVSNGRFVGREHFRKAVSYLHLKGWDAPEIAKETGQSVGAVRRALARMSPEENRQRARGAT